jgi:hypothetical protein
MKQNHFQNLHHIYKSKQYKFLTRAEIRHMHPQALIQHDKNQINPDFITSL